MTYEELHRKTVTELREIAQGLNHDTHHHLETGFDKPTIKARMRELRRQRQSAVQSGDPHQLHTLRREWHTLNHRIRAHTV
jgi:hypothetical protein